MTAGYLLIIQSRVLILIFTGGIIVKRNQIAYSNKKRSRYKNRKSLYFFIFILLFIVSSIYITLAKSDIFVAFKDSQTNINAEASSMTSTSSDSISSVLTSTVSTKNIYKSNISITDSIPDVDRKIDLGIEKEIDNANNTFQNPLIIKDPFNRAPLTAVAVFSTEEAAIIKLTVEGDKSSDSIENTFQASKRHRIPIIGLYPGRTNKVKLEIIIAGNVVETKDLSIVTKALPKALLNSIQVTKKSGEEVPGLTMISGQGMSIPYTFDSSGIIRWYTIGKTPGHEYYPLSNGRFIFINEDAMVSSEKRAFTTQLYDMDFLGRIHNIYIVPKGAHHDITEKTPGGNLFYVSSSFEGHAEDLVAELDRKTGKIVKELKLGNVIKKLYDKSYDWAHINTIEYNPKDGSVLISPRNISSGVKINWMSGKIIWILSDPAIWKGTAYEKYVLKPVGPTQWHYEQHAIYQINEDIDNDPSTLDIILFDNRSFRINPAKLNITTGLGKSFVTQYAVDEKKMTVKQVKLFPNTYSNITSNFNLFYKLNRLIAYHASVYQDGKSWGEVYEYEYSTGKLISSYKLKGSYYRGYRINFDFIESNKPMVQNDNPIKGSLTPLKKLSTIPKKPSLKIPFVANMHISADMLYIKAPLLTISKVALVSTKSAWYINMATDPKKNITSEKLKTSYNPTNVTKYDTSINLLGIPKGKYYVYLNYYGVDVDTGGIIEIK